MFCKLGYKLSAILVLLPVVIIIAFPDIISFDFSTIVASIPTVTLVVNVWQSLVAYTIVDLSLGLGI